MRVTPLDAWLAGLVGGQPTPAVLWECQRRKLAETFAWAKNNSRFYAGLLEGVDPSTVQSPEDMARVPVTRPADISGADADFLCVSQSQVARLVTMQTSGTTGAPKRLHFTAQDLECTIDFFHHGIGTFTEPGQRVLAFLPGKRPGSVGDLLARGLERLGAKARIFGPVLDPQAALEVLLDFSPQVVVGLPVQMLGLARLDPEAGRSIQAALLVSDHVAGSVTHAVENAWNCRVFTHWGMTETGLGGGVECEARAGYHLREADLYVEVVDPGTNKPLPPGQEGEVLMTTLTRRGMPLIRYKTGDAARIIADPCPCGSLLRRLGRIAGRIGEALPLGGGHTVSITELDETLFAVPGLLDFTATLKRQTGGELLEVAVCTSPGKEDDAASSAVRLLDAMSRAKGLPVIVTASSNRSDRAMAKRTIADERIQRETTYG